MITARIELSPEAMVSVRESARLLEQYRKALVSLADAIHDAPRYDTSALRSSVYYERQRRRITNIMHRHDFKMGLPIPVNSRLLRN